MRLQRDLIQHAVGELCPACVSNDSKKKKGILIKKNGKFGVFLGCSLFPDCKYTDAFSNLERQADKLLKRTRRGKRKKKP